MFIRCYDSEHRVPGTRCCYGCVCPPLKYNLQRDTSDRRVDTGLSDNMKKKYQKVKKQVDSSIASLKVQDVKNTTRTEHRQYKIRKYKYCLQKLNDATMYPTKQQIEDGDGDPQRVVDLMDKAQ